MKCYLFKFMLIWLILVTTHVSYSQSISIMSFNIRYDNPNDAENYWGKRKEDVTNLIKHYQPDFLGIQEGLLNQVEFIKANTSGYGMIGVGREDGKKKGEFSSIFFNSKTYELIKQNTFWLSEKSDTISIGWDAVLERICTYGKFRNKNTNEIIYIFNTHFDHMGTKAREMSAKLILTMVDKLTLKESRVIVMGDLNSEPESKPIRILKTKLIDGKVISKKKFIGPIGTYNGFNTDLVVERRIDYIFTKNLEVNSYRHIDDKRLNNYWVSDHLPVLIEVSLKN